MAISGFKGPVVSFGAFPQADNNEFEGPDVHNASSALQDPRTYTAYSGGNWVCGWFQSGRGFLTLDATPGTINATCIAATQSAGTTFTLASANNSTSQIVVNAQFVNVNSGTLVTGALAIGCPDATATSPFLAFGSGGTRGTSGVNVWDPTRMVARTITVTTAGTDTGRTVVINGNDVYGVPMTQSITTANTSAVSTTKAFKYIRSITIDAAPTQGISIGVGTVFGLPIRADTLAFVQAFHNTTSATAIVAANTTASDATSGDARGTFICAVTGNSRVTVFQSVAPTSLVALTNGTSSLLLGNEQA